jgi:uncharacterized cupin superfamily protein
MFNLKELKMEVKIEKLTDTQLKEKGVFSWGIWEKEVSRFPWHYDSQEECYLLEGEVEVTDDTTGSVYKFGKGDFVTFPEGMNCRWNIRKAVRKHYNFK